jgi:hypothetical protein
MFQIQSNDLFHKFKGMKSAEKCLKGVQVDSEDKESLNNNKLRQSLSNTVEENINLKSTIKQLKEELGRRGKMIARITSEMANEDRLREIQRMKGKVLYIN